MLVIIRGILLLIAVSMIVVAGEDIARTISILFCSWTLISAYTFFNSGISAKKAKSRNSRRYQINSMHFLKRKAIGSSVTLSLIVMAIVMRSLLE